VSSSSNPSIDIDVSRARAHSKPKADRFIHRAELLNRVGVSYTTIWTWVAAKKFPAPHELVSGDPKRARLAWLESEIDAWFASRPKRLPNPKTVKKPRKRAAREGV
jgi:prophage regulatory protein